MNIIEFLNIASLSVCVCSNSFTGKTFFHLTLHAYCTCFQVESLWFHILQFPSAKSQPPVVNCLLRNFPKAYLSSYLWLVPDSRVIDSFHRFLDTCQVSGAPPGCLSPMKAVPFKPSNIVTGPSGTHNSND